MRRLSLVLDLIHGATRERSWGLLKKDGILVSTRSEPSQETAKQFGVRSLRFTVAADGNELSEIAARVASGKVVSHFQQTFLLSSAADALALVEEGHAVGKVVLKVI
jgi:NADPH:quinone reductase-like Zn-dependent oxidoreductase